MQYGHAKPRIGKSSKGIIKDAQDKPKMRKKRRSHHNLGKNAGGY